MASKVIVDIKRWQAQSFNLQPIPAIQTWIEESLNQASSEHLWALSLEREPREREDEKMARLLQESGFL
jgi:son of sevenless